MDTDARLFLLRGVAYQNTKNSDAAIADLTRALTIDPSLAMAYSWRGIALSAKGENDLALADFSKAIEYNPQDAQAFYNRGVVYYFRRTIS